jgi:hypothetical protein
MCRNLLYHAFKKPETRDALRTIHVTASIHAGMRWDKDRKFKPNDYYDFEHATAALRVRAETAHDWRAMRLTRIMTAAA